MANRRKNARQRGGYLLSNESKGGSRRGEPRSPRARRRRAEAANRRGERGLVRCRRGQDRQGARQPRAASWSAASFPFAREVSACVCDGVQEIDKSFFCFNLARRA